MGLLTSLNLPVPKSRRGAATPSPNPAAAKGAPAGEAQAKAKPAAAPADDAELARALGEASRIWKELADDAGKRELALAVQQAQKQREDAAKLGDQTARAEALKKTIATLKEKKDAVLVKLKGKAGIGAASADAKAKPDAAGAKKDEEKKKDGTFKTNVGLVTDKGKLGVGVGHEAELEQKTKKGNVVTCTAAFEGKAWVESAIVPYKEPAEVEMTFHLVVGGKAGAGFKREREQGVGGGVHGGVSVELELVHKRTLPEAASKDYLAAVKAGAGGGWEELRALKLAATGSLDEARVLIKKLGGKEKVMAEGEEVEQSLTTAAEGGADVSAKKGAFGIGFSVGTSASGSLKRKIAMKDGQYWITLEAAVSGTAKGGVGGTFEGIGMNVSGEKEKHRSRAITIVVDPGKPQDKPLLQQALAAKSMAAMDALRKQFPSQSFDVKTEGSGEGSGVGVSAGGGGIVIADKTFGAQTEIVGPDGVTRISTGGNTGGASGTVGDKVLAGSRKTDQFTGGAGPDNKGFGETSSTETHGDLMAGLGELADKLKKSPLTTAKNLKDGKEELSKEVTHVEGAALTDDSYDQLATHAKAGRSTWGKYWRGSIAAYTDWMATHAKVLAAGDDRQKIAKAIADFERGSGRGRHETVRNAITGTEVVFEFPAALAPKKPFYDKLIVNNPIPAALGAGKPAEVVKKLDELRQQLSGFRDDMSKSQDKFGRLDDFQDMAERIDQRRDQVLAALTTAKAQVKAEEDEKKGVNQFTPKEPNQSKVDPAKEQERIDTAVRHVAELKQSVGDAYQQEQAVFVKWDKELDRTWTKPDLSKLYEHRNKLKALYPRWDKQREALRQALTEAGKGFDPGEADLLKPDRPRYKALYARMPYKSYGEGLPGDE